MASPFAAIRGDLKRLSIDSDQTNLTLPVLKQTANREITKLNDF